MHEYILGRSKQLSEEIEKIISNVSHKELRGHHAEEVFKDFLVDVLPRKYSVDTGVVCSISKKGKVQKSRQVDIVIYDGWHSPPLQTLGGFKIFPSESIYAIITVKVELNTNNLINGKCNCIENILSVKNLPKENYSNIIPRGGGSVDFNGPDPTMGFVFAYKTSTKLETIKQNLKEDKKENKIKDGDEISNFPEVICVLNKGYIITRPEKIGLMIDGKEIRGDFYISEGPDALLAFTNLLISMLNRQKLYPVNLWAYTVI